MAEAVRLAEQDPVEHEVRIRDSEEGTTCESGPTSPILPGLRRLLQPYSRATRISFYPLFYECKADHFSFNFLHSCYTMLIIPGY